MGQYLVAIHLPDNFNPSAADEAAMGRDIDTLNEEMVAAGVRIFVGGLTPAREAKSLRAQPDGKVLTTDGPYLETKEHRGAPVRTRRSAVMRKLNVLEFVSLDGVIQAPGGPEEDTSGGFAYGGWTTPHSDPVLAAAIKKQMNLPFDLLLGRRTFDIWAPFWPQLTDIWPAVRTASKYVASNTLTSHAWQPSVVLNGNIAEKITRIKQQEGPDLHVYGSANLVQTLLQQDLVDAFWLKVFPITLGAGIRLFAEWVDHRSCCGQRHLTPRRALPAVRRS